MRLFPTGLRAKRTLLLLASLTVSLVLVELLIPVGFRVVRGRRFPREKIREQLAELAAMQNNDQAALTTSAPTVDESARYVRHPYLGYALNLDLKKHAPDSPLMGYTVQGMKRGPQHLVVALMGGSFAAQTAFFGGAQLTTELAKASGREIRLVSLGMGGYKQPQQLMTLAYLYSLGAEFDLVINIDGFNEVALPPTELTPRGVFPLYPRDWYVQTIHLEPSDKKQLARLNSFQALRKRCARVFQASPLRWSNAALALWKSLDLRLQSRIARLTLGFGRGTKEIPWEVSGPQLTLSSDDALLEFLAENWARSSIQMSRLCKADGSYYLHCLQPNQYVEGSKPMSPEERAIAIDDDHPYASWARRGYPHLLRLGERLSLQGVDFHDLSMMFRNVVRPLYVDDCCHLNEEGYRLVVREIIAILADEGYFQQFRTSRRPAPTTGSQ